VSSVHPPSTLEQRLAGLGAGARLFLVVVGPTSRFRRHVVVIIHCSRAWACRFKGCRGSMFITYKMKTICQLKKKKKKKEEEMDTKNLPRARTTIDIVWAHFWCDPARFSSVVVLRRGGGHDGSSEAEEKPFRSTNTEIPITCRARVASQPAGSIAFTDIMHRLHKFQSFRPGPSSLSKSESRLNCRCHRDGVPSS
jgi:hypothetical protein